jgi:predicted metalloendopeptidase
MDLYHMHADYGNTGGTIGHELTHGFDDSGRRYDATGKLTDWWTEEDAKKFEAQAARLGKQHLRSASAPASVMVITVVRPTLIPAVAHRSVLSAPRLEACGMQ